MTQLLFREPVEGDTLRRVVVLETLYQYRVDVDGEGDWYPMRTWTRAQVPNELPYARAEA